ncbi:hypothetical protein D3C72_2055240 [compost metagenome]
MDETVSSPPLLAQAQHPPEQARHIQAQVADAAERQAVHMADKTVVHKSCQADTVAASVPGAEPECNFLAEGQLTALAYERQVRFASQ